MKKIEQLLKSLRATLSGEGLEQASKPLLSQKAKLEAKLEGSGAIAQGDGSAAVGERGVMVDGDGNIISTGDTHVHVGNDLTASPESLQTAYLNHVFESTNYLAPTVFGKGMGIRGVEVRFSATPRNLQYWYQ